MHADLDPPPASRDPAIAEKLRALSAELEPPCSWEELGPRVLRARRGYRGRRDKGSATSVRPVARWRVAAGIACAGALAAVGAVASWRLSTVPDKPMSVAAIAKPRGPRDAGTRTSDVVRGAGGATAVDPAMRRILSRGAAAERWLASQSEGPPVVHVGSRLVVADLEKRIASLDDELDAARVLERRASRVRHLELVRARLVETLAQVRYAELLADDTQ